MQTADIAKSTQCWCERIWAADLARSAPLTLRSHALLLTLSDMSSDPSPVGF